MSDSANRAPRVGIFGGSFDPPHLGHLILADTCREALELDRVEFIPTATSPLKPHGAVASDAHRVKMLRLATEGNDCFRINLVEIERGGISYTVDTVQMLSRAEPETQWRLIVGADSVLTMDQWHQPEQLLKQVQLAVVMRGGFGEPDFEATRQLLAPRDRSHFQPEIVTMPLIELSSTELRERIRAGRSIRYRVSPDVAQYIQANRLYRAP